MTDLAPLLSSERFDWQTPRPFFEALHAEFSFDLDVAATRENAMLPAYLSPQDDALSRPWAPHRCWLNPPYGREIGRWVDKARTESYAGALVVVLAPARTDTRWWHDHVLGHAEIRWVKGRLRFEGAEASAPFPSAVLVYRGVPSGDRPVVYDSRGMVVSPTR